MVNQLPVDSRQFAEAAFEFSVFCSNKDLDGTILNTIPHDQWVQYNSNTRVWYSSNNDIISVLKKEINLNKPDLFYIIGIYDWNYNFKPLRHFKNIPKIISVRGMLHPGALSQKSLKKKIYLAAWKMLGWHKRYRFHVTDETESGYVKKVFGDSIDVSVAGNFPLLHERMFLPNKKPGSLKLVSIALISAMKNIRLVLESLVGSRESGVFSRESEVGSIEYNIYGPIKDERYWQSCLEIIKKMPANISVEYHGEIPPADIGSVLAKHHVFILPSKSENYGHSIIEALSAGLPVITSYATPWNGLEEARVGMNVSTDDTIDIINAIEKFVGMDDSMLRDWNEEAHKYAIGKVNVDLIKGQYRDLFSLHEG